MTSRPSISVIFPTYNRCDVVEHTLEHLVAQDYPAERIEILVCDNSSDGTPAMVVHGARKSGDVRPLAEMGLGLHVEFEVVPTNGHAAKVT